MNLHRHVQKQAERFTEAATHKFAIFVLLSVHYAQKSFQGALFKKRPEGVWISFTLY